MGYNIAFALALMMATMGTFFDYIPRFRFTTRESAVYLTRSTTLEANAFTVDSMIWVPPESNCQQENFTAETCIYRPFNVTDLQCDFELDRLVIPEV